MGKIILALCNECGYKPTKITLGGGMGNHLTYCGVPALNSETDEIETVNYFANKDPKFKIYNEPNMFIENDGIDFHHWGDLKFKIHGNLCPKCKTYNFVFDSVGSFD